MRPLDEGARSRRTRQFTHTLVDHLLCCGALTARRGSAGRTIA
jgi:hypothetical protein